MEHTPRPSNTCLFFQKIFSYLTLGYVDQASVGMLEFSLTSRLPDIVPEWWFQIFFMFTPILGKIPSLTIIFKGVETTN